MDRSSVEADSWKSREDVQGAGDKLAQRDRSEHMAIVCDEFTEDLR